MRCTSTTWRSGHFGTLAAWPMLLHCGDDAWAAPEMFDVVTAQEFPDCRIIVQGTNLGGSTQRIVSKYSLLTTCYSLVTTCHLLLATCYLLVATYYLMLTASCLLRIAAYRWWVLTSENDAVRAASNSLKSSASVMGRSRSPFFSRLLHTPIPELPARVSSGGGTCRMGWGGVGMGGVTRLWCGVGLVWGWCGVWLGWVGVGLGWGWVGVDRY